MLFSGYRQSFFFLSSCTVYLGIYFKSVGCIHPPHHPPRPPRQRPRLLHHPTRPARPRHRPLQPGHRGPRVHRRRRLRLRLYHHLRDHQDRHAPDHRVPDIRRRLVRCRLCCCGGCAGLLPREGKAWVQRVVGARPDRCILRYLGLLDCRVCGPGCRGGRFACWVAVYQCDYCVWGVSVVDLSLSLSIYICLWLADWLRTDSLQAHLRRAFHPEYPCCFWYFQGWMAGIFAVAVSYDDDDDDEHYCACACWACRPRTESGGRTGDGCISGHRQTIIIYISYWYKARYHVKACHNF